MSAGMSDTADAAATAAPPYSKNAGPRRNRRWQVWGESQRAESAPPAPAISSHLRTPPGSTGALPASAVCAWRIVSSLSLLPAEDPSQ